MTIKDRTSNFREINAAVEIAVKPLAVVDDMLIERTIMRARYAPQQRARVLLHTDTNDTLHEMLIALPQESCDIPHINFKSGKSFHIVHGEMVVMIFSDDGNLVTPYHLRAGVSSGNKIIRLNESFWHTIIPLSEYAVFIETINGPFTGNRFAPWSPQKTDTLRWTSFVEDLRSVARSAIKKSREQIFRIGISDASCD